MVLEPHRQLLPSPPAEKLIIDPDNASHRPRVPARAQWTTRRAEIEHLYIYKRWKLRRIVQYMEREYAFVASEQMYKKRLSQWAVHKNSSQAARKEHNALLLSKSSGSIPRYIDLDALKPFLMFFGSVKDFSMMFYDSVPHSDSKLSVLWSGLSSQVPPSRHGVNATFNLAFDLLDRGHGKLAGRVVRRGFLLLEDMLSLEAPSLVWNLLGIMHCMISRHSVHVFHMLLQHFLEVAGKRLAPNHPALQLLHSLSMIVTTSLTSGSQIMIDHPSAQIARNPASNSREVSGEDSPVSHYQAISHVLEQAWILNTELLFSHFDPRLFPLYFTLNMHSSSVKTSDALFEPVLRWFSDVDVIKRLDTAAKAYPEMLPAHEGKIRPDQTLYLRHFATLQTDSIASLNRRNTELLSGATGDFRDTGPSLQFVAALVTAKLMEKWQVEDGGRNSIPAPITPRLADHVACILTALLPSREPCKTGGLDIQNKLIEQRRCIIALHEYAYGRNDPEVTGELWLLEEALVDAGRLEEAKGVEYDVMRRLDEVCRELSIL